MDYDRVLQAILDIGEEMVVASGSEVSAEAAEEPAEIIDLDSDEVKAEAAAAKEVTPEVEKPVKAVFPYVAGGAGGVAVLAILGTLLRTGKH